MHSSLLSLYFRDISSSLAFVSYSKKCLLIKSTNVQVGFYDGLQTGKVDEGGEGERSLMFFGKTSGKAWELKATCVGKQVKKLNYSL